MILPILTIYHSYHYSAHRSLPHYIRPDYKAPAYYLHHVAATAPVSGRTRRNHSNFTQNRGRIMQFGPPLPSVVPARHGHSITLNRRTDMTPRRLRPLRAITLVALIALGSAGAHRAGANAITDWNNITTDTILGALPAERGSLSIDFPMVNIAMFDAVNAIDRRYTTYIARPTTDPQGASQEAAGIGGAPGNIGGSTPDKRAQLDASYASSLAALPAGAGRDRGVAVG